MSQFPDPNNPGNPPVALPYAQGGYGRPKLRPTSVTVLAILGIIWGSFVLLGSLCQTLQFAGVSMDPNNPVVKGMHDDKLLFAWSIVGAVVNLVLGGLLLGGSIKALSLKPLGRSWMIAYSWLDIGFTLISTVVSVAVVMPRIQVVMQSVNSNPAIRSVMQISMWGGFVFALVLLAFPALILYFMSRPNVKEAFLRGMVAPTQQWGGGVPPQQGGGYPPPPGGPGTY